MRRDSRRDKTISGHAASLWCLEGVDMLEPLGTGFLYVFRVVNVKAKAVISWVAVGW